MLRKRRASRPVRREGERLVTAPAFVLCSVRSGSTLLRVLLDSHSRIHAPHELHLRNFGAAVRGRYTQKSLEAIGLGQPNLRYLLWDRVLHRELVHSGKDVIVNKTPSDVFVVDRIRACWPDSRFIFLLRHPAAIARSRADARPADPPERHVKAVLRYGNAIEAARTRYDGLTVRYEALATDPVAETRRVCEFLGVPWEEGMLDYGRFDHGQYTPGLGDWKAKIRTGKVQPPAPPPEDVPEGLRELSAAWGYLPQQVARP